MLGAPIPVLRSFDETRTKAFYCDFLGFEMVFEHRFDPGSPLYMGIRLSDCVLHLSEHYGDGCPGSSLRIPCNDVVAYAATLSVKSATHTHPAMPVARPWGVLEITIHDPSGNGLIFYSPDPAAQEPA